MAVRQTDSQLLAWANQEEQRQVEFDRKCDAAPKCSYCGQSVYLFNKYLNFDDQVFYCERCIGQNLCRTEGLFDDA